MKTKASAQKSLKIKVYIYIYPSEEEKRVLNQWMGATRWTYLQSMVWMEFKKKKESEISQSLLNQQRFETPHRKTT